MPKIPSILVCWQSGWDLEKTFGEVDLWLCHNITLVMHCLGIV